MVKRTLKRQYSKLDKEAEEAKQRAKEIEAELQAAKDKLNTEFMEQLTKNLGTENIDEIEAFIDSVTPASLAQILHKNSQTTGTDDGQTESIPGGDFNGN